MTLSAKLNEQTYYSTEITNEFGKENKFFCIGCNGELIYHRNISGTKIQHWAHKVTCPFETEPETQEHINLKNWCYQHFQATAKLWYNGFKKTRHLDKSPEKYFTNIKLNCVETTSPQGNKYLIARLWERRWW
jgi:hypothetical protein